MSDYAVVDRRYALRSYIKWLSSESREFRQDELNNKGKPRQHESYCHRVHNLRWQARISQLAYGFIRGRKYRYIESRVPKASLDTLGKSEYEIVADKLGSDIVTAIWSKVEEYGVQRAYLKLGRLEPVTMDPRDPEFRIQRHEFDRWVKEGRKFILQEARRI